ncbi:MULTISPECIES: SDR family NAD(P)-dependent oxidoreductase [unclassified Mycolicibacterium]|nr:MULTISPECIES: SDR family oxidoreductase [unclassified Mycolicibacterium]
MENKVCVVTGAASGIGRGVALKFAASGAKAVVVADINEAAAQETVELIEAVGGTASVKLTDVEVPEQIPALMQYAVDQYGSLDTLVNNVGVEEAFFADDTSIENLPLDVWEKVFRVNIRSIFLATKAAIPFLRASKNGPSILNAGSIGGVVGFGGDSAYGSTKAAISQFTRTAALELAPDVRVNAYAPGSIDTPLLQKILAASDDRAALERSLTATHLIPRVGTTEDVANLATFLASDEASFITGTTYLIEGGSLAWRGAAE